MIGIYTLKISHMNNSSNICRPTSTSMAFISLGTRAQKSITTKSLTPLKSRGLTGVIINLQCSSSSEFALLIILKEGEITSANNNNDISNNRRCRLQFTYLEY